MPVMNVTLGDLNYTLGVGANNAFLRLAGNLAGTNAAKLSSVFQRTITHARGKLFVSLQGCYTIDSQALAALALHHKNLTACCREIILVDVPTQVLQALELSHLTSLFEIFPSLAEAEKKYGHAVN
jgi:anti-anti-sigma factor